MIEQDLCKAFSSALNGACGVPIEGNFLLPSGANPKGAEPRRTALARVTVSPRGYPAYSATVAEVQVLTEVSFSLSADPDLSRTLAAFEAVTDLYTRWQMDVRAAKAALGDAVVGFRLAGGTFEDADGETKTRTFTHTTIIKTRREEK